MVISYMMAQLVPWTKDQKGYLIVLASNNLDESLRGYQAKYDCSSGDLNPIGNINKHDIRDFLKWFSIKHNMPILKEIAETSPTSELRPIKKEEDTNHSFDEQAMEFTYAELDEFGKLRKLGKSGPVTMFKRLLYQWP